MADCSAWTEPWTKLGLPPPRPDLLLGEFYAEVDGDHVAPHVKAHVFTAIAGAQVIGLSASLGIEGRLIQYDVPALPALDTALDTGGEVGEIGVQLK